MPRTLHAELARAAEQRGVSLNQLIVGLLSHSLGDGASSSAPPASNDGQTAKSEDAARVQRRLSFVLTVNLVVLLLAGAIAIALLIVAWSRGF
jgi:HicB family